MAFSAAAADLVFFAVVLLVFFGVVAVVGFVVAGFVGFVAASSCVSCASVFTAPTADFAFERI